MRPAPAGRPLDQGMIRSNGQSKDNYAGLLPKRGWPERNYRFLRHQIVPGIFKRRDGQLLRPDFPPPAPGQVSVTWIGHATFLLQFPKANVLVDPNWALWHGIVKRSKLPGVPLDHLPPIDLVLVTHAHFDHLHKKSLRALEAKRGIIVPRGSGRLVRSLGFPQVVEMGVWDEWSHGGLQVVHTPAHHWGARYLHDTHRDYGGYIIRDGNKSVFHCGDSAYFDGFLTIGSSQAVDLALLPIGAYDTPSGRDVHMNPEEALQAFEDLGARYMVPMHYGSFPLGNEAPHEPVQRLMADAHRRDFTKKVRVLTEGVPALF